MRILKYAFQNIIRNPFLSISSIFVITLLIFFVNILFVVLFASERFIASVNDRISFTINFQSGYTTEDIDVKLFVDDLRSSFSGLVVETITKEQAFQLLKSRNPDLASLVENTGENPLPDSLRIDGIPLDLYESVDAKIESKKNMLNYDKDIMNRKLLDYKSQFDRAQVIVKLLRTIEYGVYALLTLFIFTVAVIVYMVIGNSVFFHRQEIEIIELVGGKKIFIYGPFILQALFTVVTSLLLVFLVFFLIRSSLSVDFVSGPFTGIFSRITDSWHIGALFELGTFATLSLISALLATQKYVRL